MEKPCTVAEKMQVRAIPQAQPLGDGPTGGLGFLLDDNFELCGDTVNQLHGNERFANNFDGLIESDAALIDLEALCSECFGKISRGD